VAKKAGEARKEDFIVSTKGITKRYDSVVALNNVSLNVPPGATGLLGPNGAGKSTLIRILIGLITPTSGNGKVLDRPINTQGPSIRQKIGYMPEHDCLILDMNAVTMCTYMGQMVGMRKADAMQRAHEILHYIGVGEERYRKIKTYSTGMRQKIKLAQALIHDPDLLLLDEPTNGLDPKGRDEMLNLIRALAYDQKKNILLSSHLLPDVEYVCENIVILNDGEVLKQGNIKEMLIGQKTVLNVKIKGSADEMDAFNRWLGKKDYGTEVAKGGNIRIDTRKEENVEAAYQDVMRAADATGCQVRYASQSAKSLEDLFLEVIKGQRGVV
jgi:ABC-2 type transport system ATP-binding protein